MDRRQVECFVICCRVRRGFGIDVADEGKLREKFLRVGELPGKSRQLIQIFASQLIINEIGFGVIIVNRLNHAGDHFTWGIWLS